MRRTLLSALVVALPVVLAFSPVLSNDWVSWDDPEALVENEALGAAGVFSWAVTTSHMSHFQPLCWIAWASTARLLGLSPVPFHALSLLFHVTSSVLLFFILNRLCSGGIAAVAATLLFAVHPLRVEPVAWASAFPYLLSTSFLLGATLLYLRRSIAISAIAYGGSILARPLAPGFPLVLFALDLFLGKRKWNARSVVEKIPFVALSILGLILEGRARPFLDLERFGWSARFTLVADSLLTHFGRLAWPVGMTPLDPLPLEPSLDTSLVVLGALLLLGTAALAFGLRRKFPAAPLLWLSWLALLLPFLGLTPSGLQATADRYSYVSGLVIAIAIGALLTRLPARASQLGLVLAALLAAQSFRQSHWWKDSLTLWGRAVAIDPQNDLALYFHAGALMQAGREQDARQRLVELLERIPDHGPARKDLARLEAREADGLASKGELEPAVAFYSRALERDPELAGVRERRGMALFQLGRFESALPDLEASSASSPEAVSALALLLSRSGRHREAVDRLERAVDRFPEDLGLLHNLARLLATRPLPGREAEALSLARRVVEKSGGEDPRALDTLGFALALQGASQESRLAFERAAGIARSRGDENLAREIEAHARQ